MRHRYFLSEGGKQPPAFQSYCASLVPIMDSTKNVAWILPKDHQRPSQNLGSFDDGGMIITQDAGLAERVRIYHQL
jgi:hypothetical protein